MAEDTNDYVDHVLEHYESEAERHGTSPRSTMWDEVTRARELDSLCAALEHVAGPDVASARVLEIGCGNGVLLARLAERYPDLAPVGLEFSPDMAHLARGRELPNAEVVQGDVRKMPFEDGRFDVVLSERCVINLMDRGHQRQAFEDIARVLRPGGHFVLVEAFTDGLAEMNAARDELGLPEIPMAHHNLWMDPDWFRETIAATFEVVEYQGLPPRNFLSSHYFVSRVFYPCVTQREVMYNTRFVKFFEDLPPKGNFSPLQFWVLRRK